MIDYSTLKMDWELELGLLSQFFVEFFHNSLLISTWTIYESEFLKGTIVFILFLIVIRCRDLARSNGGQVNAYVKVAVLPETAITESGFQRTAVHRNSSRPFFDHRFTFDLNGNENGRIQLAVWHRDREYK